MVLTLDKLPANAIRPQDGPQTDFLASPADIVIYGGAAGGGKTYALLMECLRNITNQQFGAVIFRRTSVQIRNEGGLWDASFNLYPMAGGQPRESALNWKFPSGAEVSFANLEHEGSALNYQGSEMPLICFDELTHFSAKQWWYLLSRNRSMCGVRPYVRATCNPDCDSWVADFISWFINPDTGYPINERAGILRWFVRVGDKLIWGDHPSDLSNYINPITRDPITPKSMTFIPSKLTDNSALMAADPGYMANLLALPTVERERLLNGNWKIRYQGNLFFDTAKLMVDGRPVPRPRKCDGVFAVMDTATKTGSKNDGTGVTWTAVTRQGQNFHPLVVLDWDLRQIDGDLLISWLPDVFRIGEQLARECGARNGFLGAWIEDKASGEILLKQAQRKNLRVHKIDSRLTALGKDERAISVSGYVNEGMVKICQEAYDKVTVFKDVSKNHFLRQIENFVIGDPDAAKRADDLLDTFTYTTAIGLGNREGF